jgi:hypothetical protein
MAGVSVRPRTTWCLRGRSTGIARRDRVSRTSSLRKQVYWLPMTPSRLTPFFFMSSPAFSSAATAFLRFFRSTMTAPERVTREGSVSRPSKHSVLGKWTFRLTVLAEQGTPLQFALRHDRCSLGEDSPEIEDVQETAWHDRQHVHRLPTSDIAWVKACALTSDDSREAQHSAPCLPEQWPGSRDVPSPRRRAGYRRAGNRHGRTSGRRSS